ncbi:UNVERIFIED_CONTAM: hypothetical protein K2H54_050803 [Gekko kuhli]
MPCRHPPRYLTWPPEFELVPPTAAGSGSRDRILLFTKHPSSVANQQDKSATPGPFPLTDLCSRMPGFLFSSRGGASKEPHLQSRLTHPRPLQQRGSPRLINICRQVIPPPPPPVLSFKEKLNIQAPG